MTCLCQWDWRCCMDTEIGCKWNCSCLGQPNPVRITSHLCRGLLELAHKNNTKPLETGSKRSSLSQQQGVESRSSGAVEHFSIHFSLQECHVLFTAVPVYDLVFYIFWYFQCSQDLVVFRSFRLGFISQYLSSWQISVPMKPRNGWGQGIQQPWLPTVSTPRHVLIM